MTVVQFLKDRLPSLFEHDDNGFYRKLFEEADKINRQAIIQAWEDGDYAYFYSKENGIDFIDGEQYYNEKYGTQKDDIS
jgi:hypothetical protein